MMAKFFIFVKSINKRNMKETTLKHSVTKSLKPMVNRNFRSNKQ